MGDAVRPGQAGWFLLIGQMTEAYNRGILRGVVAIAGGPCSGWYPGWAGRGARMSDRPRRRGVTDAGGVSGNIVLRSGATLEWGSPVTVW